jgi:hypothetical protein
MVKLCWIGASGTGGVYDTEEVGCGIEGEDVVESVLTNENGLERELLDRLESDEDVALKLEEVGVLIVGAAIVHKTEDDGELEGEVNKEFGNENDSVVAGIDASSEESAEKNAGVPVSVEACPEGVVAASTTTGPMKSRPRVPPLIASI